MIRNLKTLEDILPFVHSGHLSFIFSLLFIVPFKLTLSHDHVDHLPLAIIGVLKSARIFFIIRSRLLHKLHFPTMKFSLYFMGYENEEDFPKTEEERLAWCFSRKATVELTQYVHAVLVFLFIKKSFFTLSTKCFFVITISNSSK